jgi:hypothetical protein
MEIVKMKSGKDGEPGLAVLDFSTVGKVATEESISLLDDGLERARGSAVSGCSVQRS